MNSYTNIEKIRKIVNRIIGNQEYKIAILALLDDIWEDILRMDKTIENYANAIIEEKTTNKLKGK